MPVDSLVSSLRNSAETTSVELRPPKAGLDATSGIEAWIDTYHATRGLTRQDTYVFVTDSAVGRPEEHNLRHLVTNLGNDAPRERVIPFLTTKHTLDYCLHYADRAWELGFRSLVVLGGDPSVGPPRCVEHGWELRRAIRDRRPELELGGWANPHRDPVEQVGYLLENAPNTDFFLTQVVSHHDMAVVEEFLRETDRRGLKLPGMFGVFYYRSSNQHTLARLAPFLPIPKEQLENEFAAGRTSSEICARTVRALRQAGVQHLYISNLPANRAPSVLREILHSPSNSK